MAFLLVVDVDVLVSGTFNDIRKKSSHAVILALMLVVVVCLHRITDLLASMSNPLVVSMHAAALCVRVACTDLLFYQLVVYVHTHSSLPVHEPTRIVIKSVSVMRVHRVTSSRVLTVVSMLALRPLCVH
jgi:hypothetical protein